MTKPLGLTATTAAGTPSGATPIRANAHHERAQLAGEAIDIIRAGGVGERDVLEALEGVPARKRHDVAFAIQRRAAERVRQRMRRAHDRELELVGLEAAQQL